MKYIVSKDSYIDNPGIYEYLDNFCHFLREDLGEHLRK